MWSARTGRVWCRTPGSVCCGRWPSTPAWSTVSRARRIDNYKGVPTHAPGRVLTDLAVAVADGPDAISGIGVLRDREDLFGPAASMPTTWRVLDRIDEQHLDVVRQARAAARAAAWAAGAGPDLESTSGELRLDFDATITIAHSEKENAAATWKRTPRPRLLLRVPGRCPHPGQKARGNSTVASSPPPGFGTRVSVPLFASTAAWAIASPRP